MTNYERICSLSKDEMFTFLQRWELGDYDYSKTFCDLCCKEAALDAVPADCDSCLKWWLEQDSKRPQGIDYYS